MSAAGAIRVQKVFLGPNTFFYCLEVRRDTCESIAFSAKPRAIDVNSLPPRIRFSPNRTSKIYLTAGTNEEPPVRKTISTSLGRMPEESRRESTRRAICPSSSETHSSKDVRATIALRSTNPSENWNVAAGSFDKSHFTFCTARCR
jgi:hypothetical protein